MKPILSAQTAKLVDALLIEKYEQSSGLLMMENAARSSFEIIREKYPTLQNILILCGVGNNGGDGFAIARHFAGVAKCTIYFIGDTAKMSAETRTNYKFAENNKVAITHVHSEGEIAELNFNFDCIIDALIGVGGSENLRGLVVPLLARANRANAIKIAIDVPTGLCATNGAFHSNVFAADLTITMLANKRAFLNKNLRNIIGEVEVGNLGLGDDSYFSDISEWEIEGKDIAWILPQKHASVSKFDCGRIGIIAGSEQFPGAAALSANAAVASGAGLVHLFTTTMHPALMPEVIPHILSKNDDGCISSNNLDKILIELKKCDVVAIGPGLSNSQDTFELIKKILSELNCKIILDADALKIVGAVNLSNRFILTPHIGEFAKMTNLSVEEINKDRFNIATKFAQKCGACLLLKGSTTLVTDGSITLYSTSGNQGLASGGSGDVLTGMIAAMATNSDKLSNVAAMATFLHGLAADIYVSENSPESLSASKLIGYIGKAIKAARNES